MCKITSSGHYNGRFKALIIYQLESEVNNGRYGND